MSVPAARRPLRVLHVTDSYLPTVGGIELHVADLADRQRQRGNQAHVLTNTADLPVDEGLVYRARDTKGVPTPCRITDVCSPQAGYDVVHVHASVYSPLAWKATLTCCRQRLPVVYTAHSLLTGVVPLHRAAARALGVRRLRVIWSAVSEVAARSLGEGMALSEGSVRVLPNAVDPRCWHPDSIGRDSDVVTFVAVMRLAARKRPQALLRAFHQARVADAARLVVVGDGPRTPACRRWCRDHPAANVTLLGQRDRRQIAVVLAQADAFVAPATRESFGIAALEAREAGLPVLARRGTGIADFVEPGVHGLLVDSDAELAGAIRTLAHDRPLLAKMAAAVRERSAGYDWPNALAHADAAYRDAVRLLSGRG